MRPTGLLAIVFIAAFASVPHAQDGLRSASLPERPIASSAPGPGDLFRATPNTYRPGNRAGRPPHDGRGSGPGRGGRGGRGGLWPSAGWGYWPYYPDPEPERPIERETPPAGGRLQLRVAPRDALVYIDGEFEGVADDLREPGALLRAGSHRIRVEARGFASHTFDVRIEDGQTVTHRATLDREAPEPQPSGPSRGPRPAPTGAPQTMYVIPRCYAGNKPPDPATRCDLTQLRTIR